MRKKRVCKKERRVKKTKTKKYIYIYIYLRKRKNFVMEVGAMFINLLKKMNMYLSKACKFNK